MRKSDTGPFALVPIWVLELPISDRAIRLYAVLGKFADFNTKDAYPSRRTLAEWCRCSRDSIDRAAKELVDNGALLVENRVEKGEFTSNMWTVLRVPSRVGAATPSRVGAAKNENHLEREPLNDPPYIPPEGGLDSFRDSVEALSRSMGLE